MIKKLYYEIQFLKNNIIKKQYNDTLLNYNNYNIFEKFKKKIINISLSNDYDTIKINFNNEEYIHFYISFFDNIYLIEIYKIDYKKKIYLESFKYNKYIRYNSYNLYNRYQPFILFI